MVNFKPQSIDVMAFQIASSWQAAFQDSLVMRLGEGWEACNAEAIATWLRSYHLDGTTGGLVMEDERERLADFLRLQSEQLWERSCCLYPKPLPYLSQFSLSVDQCRKMAHACIEMLATWQSVAVVTAHCDAVLSGCGNGVSKLTNWIVEQHPRFTHHPSELTEPLVHDLVRVLYPAFDIE